MSPPEPPRIAAFRDRMIHAIPRAPMNRASLADLKAMPMRHLILAFLTWRVRFVPQRPRKVAIWAGGVRPVRMRAMKPLLKPLLDDVEAGADLTPRLSDLVNTRGIVLPGANPNDRGKDLDAVLIHMGLHHFHVGTRNPQNPKGRSDTLVFAEVTEDEFRIVAVAGHAVFDQDAPEHLPFFELCLAYGSRDIPAGQAFMFPGVLSSGHAMTATIFSNVCEDRMFAIDPTLDDLATVNALYACQVATEGKPIVPRPRLPSLMWDFHDVRFGLLDRKTNVFFSLLSYYDR